MGSNGAKERSISAASHPTVSTPKKLPGDNVEILVDTPSDKMRRTYVRTPEHLFSKSSRKSPAYVLRYLQSYFYVLTAKGPQSFLAAAASETSLEGQDAALPPSR